MQPRFSALVVTGGSQLLRKPTYRADWSQGAAFDGFDQFHQQLNGTRLLLAKALLLFPEIHWLAAFVQSAAPDRAKVHPGGFVEDEGDRLGDAVEVHLFF